MIHRTTDFLMPAIARRAEKAMKAARDDGFPIEFFETWRSPYRQSQLYAQGRTAPGAVITKADAWQSWHQYGVAFDIAAKINGQWSWNFNFLNVIKFFTAEGFDNLNPFEQVHFQITGGMTTKEAEKIAKALGLPAVWLEVQKVLDNVSSHS